MVRKTTWLVLLLVVASVQVLAAACATRCDAMSVPAQTASTDNSMHGMEHCGGMMAVDSKSGSYLDRIQALPGCSHAICNEDLSVAKDHRTIDPTDGALHIVVDASASVTAIALPVSIYKNLRPPGRQRAAAPANLVPFLSNLRV
ncbi:MAG: hypothetical protein WDN23_15540 [Edaphobacter sp.]